MLRRMAKNQIEIERKYDVAPDTELPDLVGERIASVGDATVADLSATYYDTESLALASGRVTLRRRTGGTDAGWHLKLPGDGEARAEIHRALGRGTRPPIALVHAVTALTLGAPLVPVAEVDTTRTARNLLDAEGNVLAELADDVVAAQRLQPPGPPTTWREIEVELVDGDRSLLKAVGRQLKEAGIGRSPSSSKLRRVLGDAVPEPGAPTTSLKNGSAGAALLDYLARQRDALSNADLSVRTAQASVHDVRVSARRLRTALTVYRSLLDPDRARHLQAELQWVGSEVSEVRDLEVIGDHVADALEAESEQFKTSAASRFARQTLRDAERDANARAQAALTSERYTALLVDLDALLVESPWTSKASLRADKLLPLLAGRALKRLRNRAAAVEQAEPDARPTALHEARKAAKRLRYSLEVAKPAGGKPIKKLCDRAEALQEVLGDYLDTVTVRRWLLTLAEDDAAAGAFLFGRLHAQEEIAGVAFEYDYAAAVRDTVKSKGAKALEV